MAEQPDYADKNNWLIYESNPTRPVDTFFLYPSIFTETNGPDFAPIDNKLMRVGATLSYEKDGSVFAGATNMYCPYYRQANLAKIANLRGQALEDFLKRDAVADVYAALDYFFEHANRRRPFILAGHSQGSILVKIILKDYMAKHPEIYSRMVAAYMIGYSLTMDDLAKYPHLKAAENAYDTGVIISYNTEGPENLAEDNIVVLPRSVCINPINWKTDETPADSSENLGSRIKLRMIRPGIANARIDRMRGVVICDVEDVKHVHPISPNLPQIFGPASFHNNDYPFFYANLQENVNARISAFFKKGFN